MIFTSYFSNVKRLAGLSRNMVFVSIAGRSPDWFDDGIIKLEKYPKLAPKRSWWEDWHARFAENPDSAESREWYGRAYSETVLSGLRPRSVYWDLMDISSRRDVCLLCWEPPGQFCHRQLVRDWLNSAGIACIEAGN